MRPGGPWTLAWEATGHPQDSSSDSVAEGSSRRGSGGTAGCQGTQLSEKVLGGHQGDEWKVKQA